MSSINVFKIKRSSVFHKTDKTDLTEVALSEFILT